jgi:serine/threonine-protein kinase
MIQHFLAAVSDWLLSAAIMWVVYMALEPAVRARWPHSIVTWNRVLAGRWSDPQVWSDVLVGAASGSLMWIAFKAVNYLTDRQGGPTYLDISLYTTLGTRQWIGAHADVLGAGLRLGIVVFLAVFGLRRILRYDWLAVLAASLLFTLNEGGVATSSDWRVATLIFVAVYGALILMLLRWGLVATIMTVFFVNGFNNVTLGADWKTWYTPAGLAAFVLLLGIAVFAFWRSLGGRELIGEEGAR